MVIFIIRAYFFFKRVVEWLGYSLSMPAKRKIVVLTFDDHVDEESIRVARFLKSEGIAATFFLTLNQTKPEIIRSLAGMAHEIGGHSLDHSREERNNNYISARKCYEELSKYDVNAVSWRFPWTSKDEKSVANVFAAGFLLDSSVGAFYPVKKLKILGPLYEIPWLRLPHAWQMDVNENDYKILKSYIIRSVSEKTGVFVFGFHTYHQHKNFNDFCDLVRELKNMGVKFMTLREAFGVLKNGKV